MSTKSYFVSVLLGLAACGGSATSIEQSWTAPTAQANRMHNVVTLYVSHDGSLRRTVEDEMAHKLVKSGILATPSYTLLTPDDLADRSMAKAKLLAGGYDGVVAIRPISKEHEIEYVPGSFDGYWGGYWSYDPGYTYVETIVRVEVTAFSLQNNQVEWSATSKTVDPDDAQDVVRDVTSLAAKELRKQGIVATR